MTITPLEGWALAGIVDLDEHHPGTAGHMLRASPERRQVIAAFLSVERPHSDFRSKAETGWFLTQASHSAILRAAFGTVPCGLRGALGRAGDAPHCRRFYRYLHALMSTQDVALTKIINRLPVLDLARLRILRALPDDLQRENIIASLSSVRDAVDLRAFVAILEGHGVDRSALIAALACTTGRDGIANVAQRWTLKVRFPDAPVPASAAYRPITTGEELRRAALRFRNCMRTYAANIMERRSSFALFQHGGVEAIVHLVAKDGQWQLDRLYSSGIAPIGSKTRRCQSASKRDPLSASKKDPLRRAA